ncbi:type VII secretion-associated protein [Nocardia sp. NPDC049149]|uniref:type VII secretion-associated protein n=1 Tax=Nocardia sp. NPDC049149 TaxID=3364315 RepID=UPI00371E9845
MSAVQLVVTATRVWARGATTHWDMPPSVVLGSNGFDLVVGQSLTPPTQVSSAVQYVSAEAIALLPRTPSVVDALSAVFATVLENLRVTTPCDRITLICPTEWGGARRAVLDQAARRFTAEVAFEELAVRAVAVDAGTSHSRRTLVLEFGALSATASAVIRGHQGVYVEACEHEPNLALAEVHPDSRGFTELCGLIARLVDGRPVDLAQAVGVTDQRTVEVLRAAVQRTCGPGVELRSVAGPDLVPGRQTEPIRPSEVPPALPQPEWMQPLRERAAQQSGRRGSGYVSAVVAAVAVVAVAVIVGVVFLNRSDAPPVAGPTSMPVPSGTAATSGPESPGSAPPSNSIVPPTDTATTVGRLRFQVPNGWHVGSTPDVSNKYRVDLSPDDGARLRITVTHTLVPGVSYEQLASRLEDQISQRPSGVLSELQRDVRYGGRPGLAYTEHPGDGSTVRWHVLLENGVQVSVGCQYAGDSWPALSTTCDQFGGSLRVIQ